MAARYMSMVTGGRYEDVLINRDFSARTRTKDDAVARNAEYLKKQVEEITSGAVSGEMLGASLSFGVAVSIGISMVRVLTGLNILYFLIPGYGLALVLSFFVPKIFTAIAFDSGGVASGPMTAAFLLPFAMGACSAADGNVVTDAFGVVAMVAMTPLITIQLLGLVYQARKRRQKPDAAVSGDLFAELDDNAIIEL